MVITNGARDLPYADLVLPSVNEHSHPEPVILVHRQNILRSLNRQTDGQPGPRSPHARLGGTTDVRWSTSIFRSAGIVRYHHHAGTAS